MKLKPLNLALIAALSAGAVVMTGCDSDSNDTSVASQPVEMAFEPIDVPAGNDKAAIQVSKKVTVNGEDQEIGYQKLLATGEQDNGETYGAVKDYLGNPILFEDASAYICNGTNAGVGSGLDYVSILERNDRLYMVSQFECQVGAMYMNEVEQDAETGALSVKPGSLKFIDQSDEFGGFVHCAGQATPWQSHLGSEEYEPDARSVEEEADPVTGLTGNKYFDETIKFWDGDASKINPYYYGWTPEVKITDAGDYDYAKHYAMGRFSHELSYVMPDEKTVYMSDDGTNVGLFMFVADEPKDLSSGKLYAAKWNQVSDQGLGEANISWIDLGHANNEEVRNLLDPDGDVTTNDGVNFSDVFEVEAPTANGTCPTTGFTSVNTTAGHECLKLKDINKDGAVNAADGALASRLETRRYAAMQGATTEFRKEEGITFNQRDNKLYVAMSQIARGMESYQRGGEANDKYDIGGPNDIRLPFNDCGGVYEMDVATNKNIGSDYVAYNMKGLVAGEEKDYSGDPALSANSCDVNKIANPDNITYLDGSDTLIIGEDTGNHENNMIWAYDIKKGSLDRIFTTPLDAETTSPFWYKDVNGHGYMTAVTQHPMEDQDSATESQKQSEVGVVGPFKFTK
ncbi:PhoX family phosphatase [Thiomicrospira sp. WB1]|uniref:PhoX family protein n=1 Tax=Thiomicrospira sp. WB1 TaxID=1685380 RepID=UPI00074AF295|nr:alkaline phosphatase PhoX [Thiomicrospira sp. WB1]KUJ73036.1 hypothetical protein AVO41_01000 [Thiomicrospira sp. WB1]